MRVSATEEVLSFVGERGGVLYVRPRSHKCCAGAMVLLEASTDVPSDPGDYTAVGDATLDVRWRNAANGLPQELVVKLDGLRRKRPAAFWDGCAYKP